MRPFQVAHVGSAEVHPLHRLGGASQRRIVEMASRQAQLGYEVAVYAAGQENMAEQLGGFELRTVRCLTSGPVRRLEFLVRATADLRRRRPDLVHFHGIPEGAVAMRGVCPTVMQYDFYIFMRGRFKALYRRALRKFDRLLPVSRYCQRAAIEYWDIPQVPNQVLYNGVNVEQFSPDPAAGSAMRARYGIDDAPVMLYVGRVCEQKGTDTLLGAYELLRARMPRTRLVVAGPPGQFGRTEGIPLTSVSSRLAVCILAQWTRATSAPCTTCAMCSLCRRANTRCSAWPPPRLRPAVNPSSVPAMAVSSRWFPNAAAGISHRAMLLNSPARLKRC